MSKVTGQINITLIHQPDGDWVAYCYPYGAVRPFTSDMCDSAVTAAAQCAEAIEANVYADKPAAMPAKAL